MAFEDRFTESARSVFEAAQAAAADLGHTYIGSEHILYGLAGTEGGAAAKVLRDRWQIYNTELQIVLELERSGKALIIAPDSIGSLKILTQDHTQLDQLYEKGLKDAEKIRGFLND